MMLTKTWWRNLIKSDDADEIVLHEGEERVAAHSPEVQSVIGPEVPLNDVHAEGESEELDEDVFDQEQPRPLTRSKIETARDFFSTELIYRFDVCEPTFQDRLRGSYRLEIKGTKGGVWTLFIGNQLEVLNRREEAEVVISCQQRDFIQLVNGDLNPQVAILAQKLKLLGDVRKVVMLQSILCPPDID